MTARGGGGALSRLNNPKDLERWANNLTAQIEQRLNALEQAIKTGYVVTNNAAPNRSLDAAGATLAQTRVVLATLIEDWKAAGGLG